MANLKNWKDREFESQFELQSSRFVDADNISSNLCPDCKGPLTLGEEAAAGICTDCYFKHPHDDSSTGEVYG